MSRIATRAAIASGIAGLTTLVARSLPEDSTPLAPDTFVMGTSFSDYGLGACLVSAGAAVVACAARRGPLPVVLGLAALGCGAAHASWIAPRFLGRANPRGSARIATGAERFTILSQNLELGQADPASVLEVARTADVVVLVEVTEPAVAALRSLGWSARFPHGTPGTLPADGAAGTAVFSRFPLRSVQAVEGLAHQTWQVGIDVPGLGVVEVVAVHPVRPFRGRDGWRAEQEQLQAVLPDGPQTVVAGDFNAVDSHHPIRALRRLGLCSSTELAGSGWQPTFPANTALPALIEIDHVLLAPGLTAVRSGTVRVRGTDHLGVLARISTAG